MRFRHLTLIIVLLVNFIAVGQSPEKAIDITADAVAQVPPEKRARLIERLQSYVHSLSNNDLKNIYDLLPPGCNHGLRKKAWLKEVRVESPGRMMHFAVEEVYAGDYTSGSKAVGADGLLVAVPRISNRSKQRNTRRLFYLSTPPANSTSAGMDLLLKAQTGNAVLATAHN